MMTTEDLKAESRRWFEDGFGRGDMSVLEELMPEEQLLESSMREQVQAYRAGFPDITVTIDDQLAEGDRVMTMATFRGTHTGDLLGLPPTGKRMEYTIVQVATYADGKIIDQWSDFHPVRVLQQLGLIGDVA
jgi:predicted ester cyclase